MKAIITNLEDVAEPFRAEYEQKDGRYVLKMDGEHPDFSPASKVVELTNKVTEFRDTTVRLLKDAADIAGVDKVVDLSLLRKKVEESKTLVNPRDHQALKDKIEELEKTKPDPSDLALQFRKQLDDTVNPIKEELAQEKEKRAEAQKRANDALLHNAISDKFIKAGGKATALGYIVSQARESFTVENDEVKAKENIYSKKDVATPLGVDEWLDGATKTYDFAFAESKGGGADPGPGSPGMPGVKTGVTVLKNPTQQELGKHADAIRKGTMQIVNE